MNKFSEYLTETGFYFKNIADPNTNLFGNNINQSTKTDKITTSEENTDVKKSKKKTKACDPHKLSTYLKIVNAIQ